MSMTNWSPTMIGDLQHSHCIRQRAFMYHSVYHFGSLCSDQAGRTTLVAAMRQS